MIPRQSKRNSRADPRFIASRANFFSTLGNVTTQAHSKNLVLAPHQAYYALKKLTGRHNTLPELIKVTVYRQGITSKGD